MSLKTPRSIASLLFLAVIVAVVNASCGSTAPSSAVGPSALSSSTLAVDGGATRMTTAGEVTAEDEEPTPAPEPTPGTDPTVPAPAPVPAPLPGPESGIPNPGTNPGPFPAPPLVPGARGPIFWT